MAQDEVSEETMAAISKVPEGVILPPKEIRVTIEKAAGYVLRNGPSFELRVKTEQENNTKFSFMFETDPYYPFYNWRKAAIANGDGTDVAAGRTGEAFAQKPKKPKGPEPPAEFHYSARMPTMNAQDLEIVKLTALYVAKNGRNWMTQLSQRESGNFQFEFLRPQHSLNQFFMRLVDQYQSLLSATTVEGAKAEEARIAELEKVVEDKYIVLERARKRAEWTKHQEDQRVKQQEEEENNRKEYAQIDWDDFQVVGEIFFTEEDDTFDLPAPTPLNDLQSASLEQRANFSQRLLEETRPDEDLTQWQQQQHNVPVPPPQMPIQPMQPYAPQMPFGPTPPAQPAFAPPSAIPQIPVDEISRSSSPAVPVKRIVQNPVPRAAARRGRVQMVQCPNCKQQVPYDELEQHMKIELLDPRWREQKAKEAARSATTNLSTVDVANNLKRLASQRTDVFDPVTGETITPEEEERRKRAAMMSNAAGQTQQPMNYNTMATHAGQGMTVEEQIRLIHQRAAQGQ